MATRMACPLSESSVASLNISHTEKNNNITPLLLDKMLLNDTETTRSLNSHSNENSNGNNTHDIENASPHVKEHTKVAPSTPSECESLPSPNLSSHRPLSISRRNYDLSKSPRKISSPDRRFPVKPYSPPNQPQTNHSSNIEDILRENEGLTRTIEIWEGKDSDKDKTGHSDDTLTSIKSTLVADEDYSNIDDTVISTFSTFSAVPDVTTFSKLGQNNIINNENGFPHKDQATPIKSRKVLTKLLPEKISEDVLTQNLLEFTGEVNRFTDKMSSPAKILRHSALQNTKSLDLTLTSSPSVKRHTMSNLLDFDIPPAPTPRSIPTITPRELESLKSGFLFEISSLKASLSGKEAEVDSLKSAVGDAEKRVGESLQQFREEQSHRQQLAGDKENWERRGREMETMLRKLQEQVLNSEKDLDELEGRLAESDARRQAAELMAQEAESRMAAIRAGRSSPEGESKLQGFISEGKLVEVAVQKVSDGLHALYKDKHQAKVASLKKSYENRWGKKVQALEKQVQDLMKENKELKLDRDARITEVNSVPSLETIQNIEKIKELEAKVEGTQHENNELHHFLKNERAEKDKLIQTVEEMIPLISSFDELLTNMNNDCPSAQLTKGLIQPLEQVSNVENLRGSFPKASGIRAPTGHSNISESRIGKVGSGVPVPKENRSRSISTMGRPLSNIACKSGIMNSIERMGSYKNRDRG